MGGMELNPYEAPVATPPALPPRKLPVGMRVARAGATLSAIGACVVMACWTAFNLFDPQPPDWFEFVMMTALLLVPLGLVIAIVGGGLWVAANSGR